MRVVSRGGSGAIRAVMQTLVVSSTTGVVARVRPSLAAPITYSAKTGDANLSIPNGSGDISATAAIPNGGSQTISFIATGADGCSQPWTLTLLCVLSAPAILYQGLSSTVGRNALITASDLGNPDWIYDKNVLRHAPETLVGAIDVGVTTDVFGALIKPKVNNTSGTRLVTLDDDLDWNIVGTAAFASTTPLTSATTWTRGNRVRFLGIDTGGRRWSMQRMKRLYVEGCRGFYQDTPEDDFIFTGGDDTVLPVYPNGSRLTFQNLYADGLHGTSRGHGLPNALAFPITSDSNKKIRLRLTAPATNPVVVGADVIVSGTVYGGLSRNLNDFNGTWTVSDLVSDTEFYAVQNTGTSAKYASLRPSSSATDNTTGAVWVMTVGIGNASHSDGTQHTNEADKLSALVRIHNAIYRDNYCGTIMQGVNSVQLSNWQYIFAHAANPLLNPTDDGTEAMRIGNDAIGSSTGLKEFIQCRAQLRPLFDIWEQIAPGAAYGVTANNVLGNKFASWNRDEFRGAVEQGLLPTELQQVWADLGFGYVANKTYWGEVPPVHSNLQQITYSGPNTISASAPANTILGSLDCVHTLGDSKQIIDFQIDGETSGGHGFIHGSRLVRGLGALPAVGNTIQIKVNAIIRGTNLGIQITLSLLVVT